jgi:hypothetical protein
MTTPPNAAAAPVHISQFLPEGRFRQVRIVRHDGVELTEPCATQSQFEALVEQYRPGTDLHDPAQVYWVDRPGEWSGL